MQLCLICLFYYYQDFLKIFLMMKMAFGYKHKRSVMPFTAGIVFTVLFIAGSFFTEKGSDAFQLMFFLLDLTSIVLVCMSVEGKKKIIFSVASYLAISLLDDAFSRALSDISGKEYNVFSEYAVENMLLMTVSLVIYYTVFRVLDLIIHKSKNKVDIKNSRSIDIVVIIVAIILTFFTAAVLKKNGYDKIIFVFAASCIMILCMFYNNASRAYYKDRSMMNEKIINAQKKYYENLLEKENETRKFRHDISNHLLCVKSMLEEEKYREAEDYISEIVNRTNGLKRGYQTGNDLINTILNDISGKFENVAFSSEGLIPEKLSISDMDICTVFYNIFENAFCAAAGCGENAYVYLSSGTVSNSIVFTVKNNMAGPVTKKGKRFVSSKKDKVNHGLGTSNIMDCVEANGGKAEFDYSENEFTVTIILPNVIV